MSSHCKVWDSFDVDFLVVVVVVLKNTWFKNKIGYTDSLGN